MADFMYEIKVKKKNNFHSQFACATNDGHSWTPLDKIPIGKNPAYINAFRLLPDRSKLVWLLHHLKESKIILVNSLFFEYGTNELMRKTLIDRFATASYSLLFILYFSSTTTTSIVTWMKINEEKNKELNRYK